MNRPHILIVDDEASIRHILERTLKEEDYVIRAVGSGAEALKEISTTSYDLLLLDLHMEPPGGLEVLNQARQQDPEIVVIILTAYSSVESAVEALRLGAFDYMFKPAKPEIIRQRVKEGLQHRRQALRRSTLLSQLDQLRQTLDALETGQEHVTPPRVDKRFIRAGQLTIDLFHRQATLADRLLDLTTTEYDLLLALVEASPEPLSPGQLATLAMGYECDDTEARNIIKWHIHHLRRKIEPEPGRPRYIKTKRHHGYFWSDN